MILVLLLGVISFTAKAQTTGVETVYGVQLSAIGGFAYGEFRLSDAFALRTEAGLESVVLENAYTDKKKLGLSPAVVVEPRWYYNLNKREIKGKSTFKNSGNYVYLRGLYLSDLFLISDFKGDINNTALLVVPGWGMRRHIGKYINYEIGGGLGYVKYFHKEPILVDNSGLYVDIKLRFGFDF